MGTIRTFSQFRMVSFSRAFASSRTFTRGYSNFPRILPTRSLPRTIYAARSFSISHSMATANGNSDAFARALAANRQWAAGMQESRGELMAQLGQGQTPGMLWIGCSDSRVPETTLLGCQPGDVFVHRNVANLVHATDVSAGAAIQYAVANLGVQHVVLCGHAGCGGVAAALGNAPVGGVVDAWIAPLRRLRCEMHDTLEKLQPKDRIQALVEANVRAGVQTLREHPAILQASQQRGLTVHGVVYDIASGLLKELDVEETKDGEARRIGAFQLQ